MKQPKKLTRYQKELLAAKGLVVSNWMFISEDNCNIIIQSKKTQKFRTVKKAGKK